MAVFFACLKIEGLHQQFAALHSIQVDPLQQRSIVLPDVGCSKEFGSPLGGLQFHRRHTTGTMARKAGLSIFTILEVQFRHDIVTKVREVTRPLRGEGELGKEWILFDRLPEFALESFGKEACCLTRFDMRGCCNYLGMGPAVRAERSIAAPPLSDACQCQMTDF